MTAGAADPEADLERLAEIWATVDLERALREHGRTATEAIAAAAAAIVDPHLGARVAVIDAGDGRRLALAEPTTEGRLAATLARSGEGPAGWYLAIRTGDTLEAYRARADGAGLTIGRAETGPFGPSALRLGGPVSGPHLILVERRSLPSPP